MNKDVSWKMFFDDNERVADFISCMAFGTSDQINEKDITDVDSQLSMMVRLRDKWIKLNKQRDVVKKIVLGTTILIADIESQELVDYSYPLRELGYIYGEYEGQVRRIKRKNRRLRINRTAGEKLYNYNKNDKLNPAVVFLLYSGKEAWDGPRSLHDMLKMDGIPDSFKNFIMNHKINIINIRELSVEQIDKFKTDVGKVFACIKYSENKDQLLNLVKSDEYFNHMDQDAAEVLATYISDSRIIDRVEKTEEGKVDMCKAIDDLIADGREEGREEGQRILIMQLLNGEITVEEAASDLGIKDEKKTKV